MKYMRFSVNSIRNSLVLLLLCLLSLSVVACNVNAPLTETTSSKDTTVAPDSDSHPSSGGTSAPQSTTSTPTDATSTTPPPSATTAQPTASDVTPPTVTGQDFEITQGDSVSYRKQVSVSDDKDENPTISIDNSAVDLDTPGVYPVIYTVTDAAGNKTVFTLQLTVLKKITPAPTEEYVLSEAEKILAEITDDSLSDLQVAYSIYRWTKYNIGYYDSSDKTSWLVGAYEGFQKRRGDCFTYFSVSKALLTAAGIDNVDMVKYRSSEKQSRHYWSLVNVGVGWYHFDSTPYVYKESNFFMVTDEELSKWDNKYYKNAHAFVDEGLPERATESIQDRINYSSSKLKY